MLGDVRSAHSATRRGLRMCHSAGLVWRGCTVGAWGLWRLAGAARPGTIAAAAQERRTRALATVVQPSATVRAVICWSNGVRRAAAGAFALWARSALPDLACRRRVQRGCTATLQVLGLLAGRALRGTSAEGSTTRTPGQPCALRDTTVRRGRCCQSSVRAGRISTLRVARARPPASRALRGSTARTRT